MGEKTYRRLFLGKGLFGNGGCRAGAAGAWNPAATAATSAPAGPCDKPASQCDKAAGQPDKAAGQPDKAAEKSKTSIAPGSLPCGKIGGVSVSRLFLGGNLIGFCSHSRDLIYVHKLFRAYNTEAKIFETLEMALDCGMNTILTDAPAWLPVLKYNQQHQRKMQMMVAMGVEKDKAKMRDVDPPDDRPGRHALILPRLLVRRANHEPPRRSDRPGGRANEGRGRAGRRRQPFASTRRWPAKSRRSIRTSTSRPTTSTATGRPRPSRTARTGAGTARRLQRRRPRQVQRQHVVPRRRCRGRLHADHRQALGGVQGDGRRRDPSNVAFPNAYHNGADFIVAGMFDFQIEQDVKIAVDSLHKLGPSASALARVVEPGVTP